MKARAALLALVPVACAPPRVAPPLAGLDCAKPFQVQVAALTAQPGLTSAGVVGAEPYSYWSSDDGRVSYLITRPGSPAHPAIMMQRAEGGQVKTTGCAYGDAAGYRQLLAYLEGLKAWTRSGDVKK